MSISEILDRLDKLKNFLQKNYPNAQAFDCRNVAGDSMEQVYNQDGIHVYYCSYYDYVEIFGLSDEEFDSLIDQNVRFSHLKTFDIKEKK